MAVRSPLLGGLGDPGARSACGGFFAVIVADCRAASEPPHLEGRAPPGGALGGGGVRLGQAGVWVPPCLECGAAALPVPRPVVSSALWEHPQGVTGCAVGPGTPFPISFPNLIPCLSSQ